ncbi:MAG: 30S ribosomal protein S16 [Oligoflexia bacterium]|nr:30S ribosomal protein S16 [Oligoflexia bacterium]
MPVMIRLSRFGSKKRPYFRIVAAEKGMKRDGRFLEILGVYQPKLKTPKLTMKEDRVKHWIERGAKPSELVRDLIIKSIPGYYEAREKNKLSKLQTARKKRKQRLAKKKK